MNNSIHSHTTVNQSYRDNAREISSARLPQGGRRLLTGSALFILLFLVWAAFCEIDEITRGDGKVIPSSQIQVIQNLEGGIVSDIRVKEGDLVEKNQILMVLDDTRFSSSLSGQQASQTALLARKSRLQSLIEGTSCQMPAAVLDKDLELANRELELCKSSFTELENRKKLLTQQLAQQEQQWLEYESKRSMLSRRKEFLKEELALARTLAGEGAYSRVSLLQLERQLNDVDGEISMSGSAMKQVRARQQELRQKTQDQQLADINQAREELNKTLAQLGELEAKDNLISDQVERTRVRSPMRGLVKQIMVNTEGGVVQPGMNLIEVVPVEGLLQVEARIRPEDIGFLHPGQKAMVRFSAYDFTIHGGMEGTLTHISADSITDDQGNSFYIARVNTRSAYLGKTVNSKPVIPGMVATVDILTGKKSVLNYLLKPILRARMLAFTER